MSWFKSLENKIGSWTGFNKPHAPMSEAPIKSLISNAPKVGGSIGDNARMKQQLLDGSFKKGGSVKKTGIYKLHKGEEVIPKKKAMSAKMKYYKWCTHSPKHKGKEVCPDNVPW